MGSHPHLVIPNMSTLINVRGTKFDVGNGTLRRIPYFESLLARWSSGECSGDIFVDRCPLSFSHLLDFMIYESMDPSIDEFLKKKVLIDMDYFGISIASCTSLEDEKEEIVGNEIIPVNIGCYYKPIAIDNDMINLLDDLVEKNPRYTGENIVARRLNGKGLCCLEACIKGMKFHPSMEGGGNIVRCAIARNEPGERGNEHLLYSCLVHRHKYMDF